MHAQRSSRSMQLALVAALWPALGLGQTASVDDVLAGVAQVIRHRSQRIATESIARGIRGRLCTGTLVLHDETEQKLPYLELRLGGAACPNRLGVCTEADRDRACRRWDRACNADDVLVQSCRLLERDGVPLSDPYLLKTLTRETVALLVRVSAGRMPAEGYQELGLATFPRYIHSSMEALGGGGGGMTALVDSTQRLADELAAGTPDRILGELGGSAATRRLWTRVRGYTDEWISRGCPYPLHAASAPSAADGGVPAAPLPQPRRAGCPNPTPLAWTVDLMAADKPDPAACSSWLSLAAREERSRAFRALFESPGAPFAVALERRCSATALDEAQQDACRRAKVALGLRELLGKIVCQAQDEERRRTLRQLGAIMSQRAAYEEAGFPEELRAFLATASELELDDLPREELAAGVRLVAQMVRARSEEAASTDAWVTSLAAEMHRAEPGTREGFEALVESAPLERSVPLPPAVRALQVAAKDFLALPSLHARGKEDLFESTARSRALAAAALGRVLEMRVDAGHLEPAIVEVAAVMGTVAEMTLASRATLQRELVANAPTELVAEAQQRANAGGEALAQAANGLRGTAAIVSRASERDWVGVGLQLSSGLELARVSGDIQRALRFVRVLLSMYQVGSVSEAQGIFTATLDDEGSRARRYDSMSFDLAALAAPRAGFQWNQQLAGGSALVTTAGPFGGLYAPVGLQCSQGWWGVLAYPIDLGAYLVVQPGQQGPMWGDAVRAGLAGYVRPWRDIPVTFGAAADYRPLLYGTQQLRIFGFAALEFPVYPLN